LQNPTEVEQTRRKQAIGKLRQSLTTLAYASLVFDIFNAVITSAGALRFGNLQPLLLPVNYALTAVVILSAVVFVTILLEKAIPTRGKSASKNQS